MFLGDVMVNWVFSSKFVIQYEGDDTDTDELNEEDVGRYESLG